MNQFPSNYNDKKSANPKCNVNKNISIDRLNANGTANTKSYVDLEGPVVNTNIKATKESIISRSKVESSLSFDIPSLTSAAREETDLKAKTKNNGSFDSGSDFQCKRNPLMAQSTLYESFNGSENINAISNRTSEEENLISNESNFNCSRSLSQPFTFTGSEPLLEKYCNQFSSSSALPEDTHFQQTATEFSTRAKDVGIESTSPSLNSFYDLPSSSEVNLDDLAKFLLRGDQVQQNFSMFDNKSTKSGKVQRKIKSTLKTDSSSTSNKPCKKKDVRPSPIWSYPLTFGSGRSEGTKTSSLNRSSMNRKHEDIVNDQKAFAAHFNEKSLTRKIENARSKKEKEWTNSGNLVGTAISSIDPKGKPQALEKVPRMKSKRKDLSSKKNQKSHSFLEQSLHTFSKTMNLKSNCDNMSVSTCSNGSKGGEKKGFWTAEEDEIIILCIKEGMNKWSDIAERIPGRIGKQCRERWFNHLDPNLKKGDWTLDEDEILVQAQARWGNSWTKIARLLPGRSENAVKNRWNSASRRRAFPHAPLWSEKKQAIEAAMDALTAIDMIASEKNKSDLIDFNDAKIDVINYQKDNKESAKRIEKGGSRYGLKGHSVSQTSNTKINAISVEDLQEPQNQRSLGSSSPLSISNLSSSSACVTDPLSISNLSAGMSASYNSGATTALPYAAVSNTSDLSSNKRTNATIIQSSEEQASSTKGKDSFHSLDKTKKLSSREKTQEARLDQIKKSLSSMGGKPLIEAYPRGYISSGVKNSLLLSDLQSCPNPLLRDLAAANPKLMSKGKRETKGFTRNDDVKQSKKKDATGLSTKREPKTTQNNKKDISFVEESISGMKSLRTPFNQAQFDKDKKLTNTKDTYPKVRSTEEEIRGPSVESSISGVVPSMIRTISTNLNKSKIAGSDNRNDDSFLNEKEKKNFFEISVNSNHSFESSSSLTSLSAAFSENKIVNNTSENLGSTRKNKEIQHKLFTKDQNEKRDTQTGNLPSRKAALCKTNKTMSNSLFSPSYPFNSSVENSILKNLNVFDHEELSCQDVNLLNRVSGGEIMEIPNSSVELEVYNSDFDTDIEAFKSSCDDANSSSLNIDDLKNGENIMKDNIMPLLDEADYHRYQYLNDQQLLHYTYPIVHGNLSTPNTLYGKEDENRISLNQGTDKYFGTSENKSDILGKPYLKESENRLNTQKDTPRSMIIKNSFIVNHENTDNIEDYTSKYKIYESSHLSALSRNDNDKGLINNDNNMKSFNILGNDLHLNGNSNTACNDEDLFFMQ